MGTAYTRFQTKTAQKPLPDGAAHTYMAYVREYPPPPGQYSGTRDSTPYDLNTDWVIGHHTRHFHHYAFVRPSC